MTLDEAKSEAKILEKINLDIWNAKNALEKNKLIAQFRERYRGIVLNGYKVLKSKTYDPKCGYRIPRFKIREDDSQKFIEISDNRSKDAYPKGDCTTRCISFCTGIDYETIQKEQFKRAKEIGRTWREYSVWSKFLFSHGYSEIKLPRNISGKVFLRTFKDSGIDKGMIAALSANHIAAIDMAKKKILDVWNSAGCRIHTLFVPTADREMWNNKIRSLMG